MILGTVNSDLQAMIQLTIHGSRNDTQDIDAMVDTGLNGWLTLPSEIIDRLQLHYYSRGRAELADGSQRAFDVFEANVNWDGAVRRILVYHADAEPLIGMELLSGYRLKIDVEHEGAVTIQRLVELTRS